MEWKIPIFAQKERENCQFRIYLQLLEVLSKCQYIYLSLFSLPRLI